MRALASCALVLAGCLEVPSGQGQQCTVDTDCNTAAGEVCYEGLCYGDPPLGTYAATLSAPVSRDDLIATEIPELALTSDGDLGELALEAPVTFSGRIEAACTKPDSACTTDSIGAQIRITRPSRFPGGPALRLVALSKAGVPRGTDSFTIQIPRTHPGDAPYVVTIDPEGGGDLPPTHGGEDPAQIVPPKRITLVADGDLSHQTYVLGSSVQISGVVKDALGNLLTKYRVVALGRWDAGAAPTEVSSVDYSTDGTYSIALAEDLSGTVEVVARPYDPLTVAPELHLPNVEVSTQTKNIFQPTGIGSRIDVDLLIEALAGDGSVKPVNGARVVVTATTESPFTTGGSAVLVAETTTRDDDDEVAPGVAHLSLLDGDALAGSYRVSVVPPASSSAGVVYNATLTLPDPAPIRLPQRVAVRGSVVDATGNPLGGVSVTARRSLRFLWSVAPEEQKFLDEIPAATTVTPETGEFVIWIDPTLAATWGHYDLSFETADTSPAPNWLIPDFEIPRVPGQMTISLDTVTLPEASRLHARIVDPNGGAVEGSDLRVFRISDNNALCMEVTNAPAECSADARVLGHGESDKGGTVRLTLPRP